MRGSLDAIAKLASNGHCNATEFQWSALRYQHTTALRTALMERYAPATANKSLAALRRVLKEAWRLGQLSAEDYQRAADISNITATTLPAGRALSKEEINALLQACVSAANVNQGLRDLAMLGILRAGLRRSEVVSLDVADYTPATGGLLVHGKGRKDRECYLPQWAIAAVESWLSVRGSAPGALLKPVSKSGRILTRRLTDQAVLDVLDCLVARSGIARCTPHDLRRSFASDLLDAGVDISTVSKLMGHASASVTQKYDRRGEEAKRRAVQML